MIYIRVDTNKNNTITEISGAPFIDLQAHEEEHTTNYDFPTSQPTVFYRWNGLAVEVNDENVINSYYEESLTGLDMEPHIEKVINGELQPSGTKEITIEGLNFSPFSTVEISGVGNFVNTVFFDTPNKIRIDVTAGSTEGKYNIVVYNDKLQSKDSGFDSFIVKSITTIDLRTEPIANMGLEMTSGVNVEQDSEKGVRFYSSFSSWNRGIKFSSYFWNRVDNITFEIIFTRTSNVLFMAGIGSASLNVNSLSSAYYKQEIGMYHINNQTNTFYGGGDVTNWNQNIGTTVGFDLNKFYKLKLEHSGSQESLCSLCEVNIDDWDDETLIHSWTSSCPADDAILVPFVLPQASSGAYYITGFRY